MERLPYEVVSTIFRKAILHYILVKGTTYPQSLAENLNISKGLASSFLRLCSALNIMNRKRAGHKVLYSFTSKGLAVLKRLAPEIFDLSFSAVFNQLHKKKISIKHYPMEKIGFEFVGTIVLLQDNKPLYPFGYPYAYKINRHHQNIITFRKPSKT